MTSISINFSLRTSSGCKTVHCLGSWDNYVGQLPLAKDTSKSGAWKGTFKFQGSTLRPGQRYWYYYIIDGYHVSHDPAKDHVVEPTTGRKLNTLDVPAGKPGEQSSRSADKAKRPSCRISTEVAKGRPLSSSMIQSPKPMKPGQTRHIVYGDYTSTYGYEQLAARLAAVNLQAHVDDDGNDSDNGSDVPSLRSGSSRSSRSSASSPSSVSSRSNVSSCSCERYGITRDGDRVKLDCKGLRCGYSDDSSDCSSDNGEEYCRMRSTRRQGMYLAGNRRQ